VFKVQSSCEKIQHFGNLKGEIGPITEAEALVKITESISRAREEYRDAKGWLEAFLKDYPEE
jgi:osomolarity two-component system phosphorelay intermediate protein YPD1